MMYHEIEEISTGGGCEHILIKFPDLGVCVLINNDYQKVPTLNESYDIGVYKLEPEGWMGEYFEGCFESFDSFNPTTIVARTQGYLEGKGFKPIPKPDQITAKMVTEWVGSDHMTHDHLVQLLVEIANGIYKAEELYQDVLDYSEGL